MNSLKASIAAARKQRPNDKYNWKNYGFDAKAKQKPHRLVRRARLNTMREAAFTHHLYETYGEQLYIRPRQDHRMRVTAKRRTKLDALRQVYSESELPF